MISLTALAASFADTLGKRVPASYALALSEQVRAASGCADCGTREPVSALAFDHIDPSTKYRTATGRAVHPADMCKASGDGMTRYALRTIIAEWAKCEVRCANCHAARTFPERITPRPVVPPVVLTHHDHLVCVFCDNELPSDARVCMTCREYKGVMTVEAWQDYLGRTWDCDCT
jgi:hypothetical protein